ncbi:MAG TPA: vitamin K epoxide reductase family protein [Streptosporangiaceae bacterium]|nr:vitamin K epoxide reductase family protein [Streptosporangiaceae bacterium]
MAPQKQAKRRRQAVSAKKKASHGGKSRTPVGTMTIPSTGTGRGPASDGSTRGDVTDAADPIVTGGAGMPQPSMGFAGWIRARPLQFTMWLLSLFGLGVSIYLTIAHYDTAVGLSCPDTGVVNCLKVTTSSQSMVFGIFPVAVLGLAFYVFMALVNSPFGRRWDRREVNLARLGSIVVGMGFVLYLVYVEVVQIGNICLWCTSVHVATFLLFALMVYEAASWTSRTITRSR